MKFSGWLSVVAVLLGAIPSFVRLGDIPFDARLTVVGGLGLLSIISAAFVSPKRPIAISGLAPSEKPALLKKLLARFPQIIILAALTTACACLFWITLWYHNISIRNSADGTDIMPPHSAMAEVELRLLPECNCRADDIPKREAVKELEQKRGKDHLRATNFIYPQAMRVTCTKTLGDLSHCLYFDGSPKPPMTRIIWPDEMRLYTIWTIVAGGTLWLLACLFVMWRSWQ